MGNQNLAVKLYAVTLTFVLAYLLFSGHSSHFLKQEFDEITVERINIVEPDGKLKMVISNAERQHPGMFDGEMLMERERPPGMIFFNEEQDEVGGLVYQGNEKDGMGVVLSIDQYKNDQVMQMLYNRYPNGRQQYGLNIWDRAEKVTLPKMLKTMDSLTKAGKMSNENLMNTLREMNDGEPVSAQRLFTGKNVREQVGLFINDEDGNPRMKLYINENNEPKMEILNEKGEILKDLVE